MFGHYWFFKFALPWLEVGIREWRGARQEGAQRKPWIKHDLIDKKEQEKYLKLDSCT